VADESGRQVDQLVSLVKENGETLEKMKEIMKGDVCQVLIRTVIQADEHQDFKIEGKEIEFLIMRMENIDFVTFDEDKLRLFIEVNGGYVDAIIQLACHIFDKSIPAEERIFEIINPETY